MDRLLTKLEQLEQALPPRMISIAEAVDLMGISTQTARAQCERGAWRWQKCGRRILVDASSLRAARAPAPTADGRGIG